MFGGKWAIVFKLLWSVCLGPAVVAVGPALGGMADPGRRVNGEGTFLRFS